MTELAISDQGLAFFEELLNTPSPSGYEEPVQRCIRQWAQRYADEVRTDLHGNVIAVRNPAGSPRILLDGHCDQIGLLVQHIDDAGYLYVQAIGGWDMQILLGQSVTVWSASGPIAGVIARKATHLLGDEERKKVPDISDLWIDIGSVSKAETSEIVAIGDPVTLKLGMRRLRNGLVSGPKMDDTAGLWVVFDALRRLAESGWPSDSPTAPALYVVSAVQEEIGLRGAKTAASGIAPHVGIAVDVTHATDCPTVNNKANGDIRIGKGPVLFRGPNVNPALRRLMVSTAEEQSLPVQTAALARGASNDANVIQLTHQGVAAAAVGIPNRYMHSPVEVIALADLCAAAELLAQTVRRIDGSTDFTPG